MRFHHRGLRVDFPDFPDDFLFFLFCDLITLGKHKYIRPLHTVQWFSEKSSRQQMPGPKRICTVDKHYVQVSVQPPVLKSIIQKKNSSESITDALAISAQPQAHSRSSSVASTAVEAHT